MFTRKNIFIDKDYQLLTEIKIILVKYRFIFQRDLLNEKSMETKHAGKC